MNKTYLFICSAICNALRFSIKSSLRQHFYQKKRAVVGRQESYNEIFLPDIFLEK
jgi:hypothetical protein